jgi:hypothetical protein
MAAAGDSKTPLVSKLGIKPGHRLVFVGCPDGWEIPDLPPGVTVVRDGIEAGGIIVAFVRSMEELDGNAGALIGHLSDDGALWIAWPRRAGGHTSDVTENELRRVLLPTGVVDVKVAALDDDWSGLKFVWRKERRGQRSTPG